MGKKKASQAPETRMLGMRERVLLMVPETLFDVLLLTIPLCFVVLYSFWTIDLTTLEVTPGFSIGSYAAIMKPIYLTALGRSLLITVATVAGTILLGFPLAYFISQCKGKPQVVLLVLIMVPFWTSFVIRAYAWTSLLAPTGMVNQLLTLLHVIPEHTDLRYTDVAIVIGMVYSYLPEMVLPLYATLEKLDTNLFAAAADLGRSTASTFFTIAVPESKAGIAAGCLLVAIPALGEYTIPAILGGGKTLMIGNVIASEFITTGNYSRGAALATMLLAIVVMLIVVSRIISSRKKVA
ncbi:MAG: ABC transporter permease [Atopobiaceae bacterium]|nr:ABC transporter permease [Atopobiaceae bacterium]MCI1389342.1 ABC transporter permease [Atopobiaceae bacterium]MCI1432405.1 ABC transporter permease [Atopobiaceae bacterium]